MVMLRKKYEGLSSQDLMQEAYRLGFNFEKYSMSCSQSTVAALHELLEIDSQTVKLATSAAGGTAIQMLGTCGALTGGIIALDYFFGRPVEKMSYQESIPADTQAMFTAAEVAGILADRFIREYGTFICINIQRQLFGRTFWPRDPEDLKKLEELGVHSDPRYCCNVVGNAAKWTMEILLDKGVI